MERHIFLIFARPETAYLPRFVFISNSDDGSDRAFEPDLQTGKEELSGAGKVGARRAETGSFRREPVWNPGAEDADREPRERARRAGERDQAAQEPGGPQRPQGRQERRR